MESIELQLFRTSNFLFRFWCNRRECGVELVVPFLLGVKNSIVRKTFLDLKKTQFTPRINCRNK